MKPASESTGLEGIVVDNVSAAAVLLPSGAAGGKAALTQTLCFSQSFFFSLHVFKQAEHIHLTNEVLFSPEQT